MDNTTLSLVERENLLDRFHRFTQSEDMTFELDGPIMSTVQKDDGTFRNYILARGDFFLTGFRPSSTGEELLIFSPLEPLPKADEKHYKHMEVRAKNADKFFPMFCEAVLLYCRETYVKSAEPDLRDMIEPVIKSVGDTRQALDLLYSLEAEQIKSLNASDEQKMLTNPNFGMF